MASKHSYRGQCLCGAVEFRINGALDDVHACHCGQCRRQSGNFIVSAGAAREDFEIIRDDGLSWYQSSDFARRGFCRNCGSALFWDDGVGPIGINVGSLDQPTGLRTESHIFVEDKGDYYDIDDGLPLFRGVDTPF